MPGSKHLAPFAPPKVCAGSQKLTEVCRSIPHANVVPALAGNLERRTRGVRSPPVGDLGVDFPTDDGHPFRSIRTEMVLARRDDADRHSATETLVADTLDFALEIRIVFEHGISNECYPTPNPVRAARGATAR